MGLRAPLSEAEVKTIARSINPRFRLGGFGRDEVVQLLRGQHDPAERNPAAEWLLRLLHGLAVAGGRLQEYSGELNESGVESFFRTRRTLLRELSGAAAAGKAEPERENARSLESVLMECKNLREQLLKDRVPYLIFDGRGAKAREAWLDRQILSEAAHTCSKTLGELPFDVERLGEVAEVRTVDRLATVLNESILAGSLPSDAVATTIPRQFIVRETDACDFVCTISQGGQGFLSHYKRTIIGAVLRELKEREREEVREPGYRKPYMNLSLYEHADAEHEVHQYLGMGSAVRYVIDLQAKRGQIWGLCDVRIVRSRELRALDVDDLVRVFAHGEALRRCLETIL